jgi:hypothetical protein
MKAGSLELIIFHLDPHFDSFGRWFRGGGDRSACGGGNELEQFIYVWEVF